jgi:hypothetical protein
VYSINSYKLLSQCAANLLCAEPGGDYLRLCSLVGLHSTAQFSCHGVKVTIKNTETNEYNCAPIKLYLLEQEIEWLDQWAVGC